LRLLRDEPDGDAVRRLGLAEEVLVHPGHDAQERRLPRPVRTDDADLGPREERQVDALQHLLVRGVNAAEVLHREDVLVSHAGAQFSRNPADRRALRVRGSFTSSPGPGWRSTGPAPRPRSSDPIARRRTDRWTCSTA